MAYSDSHNRAVSEVKRFQDEEDKVMKLPPELVLELNKEDSYRHHRVEHVLTQLSNGISHKDIVASEKKHFDDLAAKFDFDTNSVNWLQTSPFIAEFTRWIRKRCAYKSSSGMEVPTAAACFNMKTEEVEIVFNPRFMASLASDSSKANNDPQAAALNEHEIAHLVLQHVTSRRRDPMALNNMAQDLAINSLIARCDTGSRLPSFGLLPGVMGKSPINPKLPKEVQEASLKFRKIIADLPLEQCSEWYFTKIQQESEKQGYSWGKKGMKIPGVTNPEDGTEGEWQMFDGDSHDGWDDVPEEIRDIVESKIKHALQKACEKADSSANGWGNIPSELREEIRAAAFGSVDWRAVLRNWTGMRQSGGRSRSIKRIDRKYPLIHPGLKRSRNPSILVAIDQSGSVDDGQLARIFGTLEACSKRITFDVLPFDTSASEADLFTWRRGTRPKLHRVRGGGTDFQCVINYVNKPENRGKYDGVIIATDGECCRPSASRVKLAWLVTPGHKLLFGALENELVVQMSDKDDVNTGKW